MVKSPSSLRQHISSNNATSILHYTVLIHETYQIPVDAVKIYTVTSLSVARCSNAYKSGYFDNSFFVSIKVEVGG